MTSENGLVATAIAESDNAEKWARASLESLSSSIDELLQQNRALRVDVLRQRLTIDQLRSELAAAQSQVKVENESDTAV